MAAIRTAVHTWYRDNRLDETSATSRLDLSHALIRQRHSEDKLAAVLLLEEILVPSGDLDWRAALDSWAELFDGGHIADWNICDWFCIKVLGALIANEGESAARVVSSWTTATNVWRARAGLVPFARHARECDRLFPGAGRLVLGSAEPLIERPERFAKTAVGWVLRELTLCMPGEVVAFCRKHLMDFSLEALKNATKKAPEEVRAELIEAFRKSLAEHSQGD
jgi:3-methyladenine DNA glycosylase AlkD